MEEWKGGRMGCPSYSVTLTFWSDAGLRVRIVRMHQAAMPAALHESHIAHTQQ